MNNNVLRETEADRDPLFKHRPRLSWNFKKTPLFQSPDDYFYKTSESDREYGPFTAAQMTVSVFLTRNLSTFCIYYL